MTNLLIENIKEVKEKVEQFKKKHDTEIFLVMILMLGLARRAKKQDKEIDNLKKTIKELKSKGE